ncbi:unnamed protein product [Prunus brigantina]
MGRQDQAQVKQKWDPHAHLRKNKKEGKTKLRKPYPASNKTTKLPLMQHLHLEIGPLCHIFLAAHTQKMVLSSVLCVVTCVLQCCHFCVLLSWFSMLLCLHRTSLSLN